MENNILEKPVIYDFADYRLFLFARYRYMKAQRKSVSFRSLAKQANVTPNYYKYIFDQRKNISLNRVFPTAKAFGLDLRETEYLLFKVIRQTIKEKEVIERIDEIIHKIAAA